MKKLEIMSTKAIGHISKCVENGEVPEVMGDEKWISLESVLEFVKYADESYHERDDIDYIIKVLQGDIKMEDEQNRGK